MKKILICLLLLCLGLPTALAENISFTDTVVPSGTVEVYADSSARVDALHMQLGDAVNAGDALATLHTVPMPYMPPWTA